MKKMIAVLIAMIMVLTCCVSLAEGAAVLTTDEAIRLFGEFLDKIVSTEDKPEYYVGSLEYGLLASEEVDPAKYTDALKKAELVAADREEAPDGEYVFLRITDQLQLDFFQGEAEKNYIRVDLYGDPEKSALLQAKFPEDFTMTVSGLVETWADELAAANGIQSEGDAAMQLDSGWVLDSLNGVTWQADRASLTVIPEEDGIKLLIVWGSSAWESTEWTYAALPENYDADTDTLTATHLIRDEVVYDDSNAETRTTMIDQDCEAVFALNDLGQLQITDAGDEALEGLAFTMIPAEQEGDPGLYADYQPVTESPEWVAKLPAAQDAEQLFVVAGIGMDKTTAYISMHQKTDDGTWNQILSTPGFVGKMGLCADADHAEGCAQTPVGVYHFNRAFGIASDPGCAIPYFQVNENTWWSGDFDRQYNQMVDIRDVPELDKSNSEYIMDYLYQYQYCLNISFNEEGTPGRGSAIFLHCLGPMKPWTGGCVAIPENIMKLVMQYVQEDCVVVIDTAENLGITF